MKISLLNEYNNDCPPYLYIRQISKNIPCALHTYLDLWKLKNEDNTIIISKKQIPSLLLIAHEKFKNDLLKLCSEGFLNIDQDKKQQSYKIELVGWSNDE